MNRETLSIPTPGALIETLVEAPEGDIHGLALIAHPHPLHGGTLHNKVAATLAKAALNCGHIAIRPNFRGVGASTGEFDHGVGETEDMLALATWFDERYGGLPWNLLGFSFGAYVQHKLAQRWPADQLIMVGPAMSLYTFDPPAIPTHIIQGDQDELIPLSTIQNYAAQHAVDLRVIHDASHFFHGKLVELRQQVEKLLCRHSS